MNPPFDNEPVVKPELYVEVMNLHEKATNEIEDEDTKSYLEELEGDFSHVMVVYEAFMRDPKAHLFIAVRNKRDDANSCTIYFFTKQNSRLVIPTKTKIKSNILSEIISKWDKLREHIIKQSENDINDIIRTGTDFYECLLKDVLPKGCDRMCEVWIYCEDANIDPIWEWLCTKNSSGEDFFWGDEFYIVRIPAECDLSDCQVSISNEVIILADSNTGDLSDYAQDIQEVLEDGVSDCKVINSPEDTKLDIPSVCIIYAAGDDTYTTKLETAFSKRKKNLFLNLYPSSLLQLEVLPVTWLDSRFEGFIIPEKFTLSFVKRFFDVLNELLEEGNNEEGEVKVAEILTKTRKGCSSLWRLAYVVNGNPCTKLTRPRH